MPAKRRLLSKYGKGWKGRSCIVTGYGSVQSGVWYCSKLNSAAIFMVVKYDTTCCVLEWHI